MILKYLGCGWFMKQFIYKNQNIPKQMQTRNKFSHVKISLPWSSDIRNKLSIFNSEYKPAMTVLTSYSFLFWHSSSPHSNLLL